MIKPSPIPVNIFRGIVPTFTGFDNVNPDNLANATDGDDTTSTGVGTKNSAYAAGAFIFDLGSVKTVRVTGKVALNASSGTSYVFIESSPDNVTYDAIETYAGINMTTKEAITSLVPRSLRGRYIRIRFSTASGSNGNGKLYTIRGYEEGN